MRVVVAGGGIAGLAAAHALHAMGARVTLVEAGSRFGGKIETERIDGFLVERGPDSILAAHPAGRALIGELGLGDELITPERPGGVYVVHARRLVPMPEGVGFGVPTRVLPFLRSALFSPAEKVRAGLDLVLPRRSPDGDESIGAFLRRRFGDAVVDRLAGPLIGGVYGARVDELSLLALAPRLRDAERAHRSLVLAGLRAPRRGARAGADLVAPVRGMGSLVDALVARLAGADLRLGVPVAGIAREGAHYAVSLGGRSRITADAVVVATPAPAAAELLEALVPGAGAAFRAFPYRGTASVSLGYAADQLPAPLAGHGLVAPEGALALSACTWTSAKWRGRAPRGAVLLRATIRDERALALDDRELIATAHAELASLMRISGAPVMAHVARWPAMPRYTVGHLDRLAGVDARVAGEPRVVLAGAAYRGSGVPDCIAQGVAAAARVLEAERVAA